MEDFFDRDINGAIKAVEEKGFFNKTGDSDVREHFEKQLRCWLYGGMVEEAHREYKLGDDEPTPMNVYLTMQTKNEPVRLTFRFVYDCDSGVLFEGITWEGQQYRMRIDMKSLGELPEIKELEKNAASPVHKRLKRANGIHPDHKRSNRIK